MNLREICAKGIDKSEKGNFQLDGIVFGSDDFVADIGKVFATLAIQRKHQ